MSEESARDVMTSVARFARFSPVSMRPIRPGWKRFVVVAWDRDVSDMWTIHSQAEWVRWLAGYGPR